MAKRFFETGKKYIEDLINVENPSTVENVMGSSSASAQKLKAIRDFLNDSLATQYADIPDFFQTLAAVFIYPPAAVLLLVAEVLITVVNILGETYEHIRKLANDKDVTSFVKDMLKSIENSGMDLIVGVSSVLMSATVPALALVTRTLNSFFNFALTLMGNPDFETEAQQSAGTAP